MTPDELEKFERSVVHEENEESGPASEPDVQERKKPEPPGGPPVPPNPD